jgi:polysaccharide chain length determinant protein (PEP-CTERM system associated)
MADYYDNPEPPSTPGLGRIAQVWRRRKGSGFFAAGLVAAGAVSLTLALPNLYRASATVLVQGPQVSEDYVRSSVTGGLETRIQTIDQQVRSRARLAQVIEKLNLYPTLRKFVPIEGVVDRMRGDVNIELKNVPQPQGGNTTVSFNINYVSTDPKVAAETANALAELYVKENTSNRKLGAAQTAAFLKDEVAQTKRDMEARQGRLRAFQSANASNLPQQMEANISTLDRLNDQLRQNVDLQMRALDQRELLLRPLPTVIVQGGGIPAAETPAVRLTRLKTELTSLTSAGYGEKWPAVVAKKAEIEALEQEIAAKGNGAPPEPAAKAAPATAPAIPGARTVAQIDAEIKVLRDREAELRKQIAQFESRVEAAPHLAGALDLYARDYDSANDRHEAVLKKYADAQLAATVEEARSGEQFRVIDPAVVPTKALAPKRLWLLGGGLMAALAFGIVVIIAAERFDSSIHTAEELQSITQLPLLATVSRISTRLDRRRRRRRRTAALVVAGVAMAVIAAGTYHYASGNDDLVRLTSRGT